MTPCPCCKVRGMLPINCACRQPICRRCIKCSRPLLVYRETGTANAERGPPRVPHGPRTCGNSTS